MSDSGNQRFQILVCDGPSCSGCDGVDELRAKITARIESGDVSKDQLGVVDFTCFGRCGEGPNILVRLVADDESVSEEPGFEKLDGVNGFYTEVDEERIDRVLTEHCAQGTPVEEFVESY